MEDELYKIFLKSPKNLFDEFVNECQNTFDKPAHTMLELKNRANKKLKGDKFEIFCIYYLTEIHNFTNIWRLEDVPNDILLLLGMKRQDMGIDIIGEKYSKYYAIQCKYKKYTTKKNVLTWKELSTFYALCLKTGPWEKYIVITTCDYTRQAVRTEKDLIICKKTLQGITKNDWLKMCNIKETQTEAQTEAQAEAQVDAQAVAQTEAPIKTKEPTKTKEPIKKQNLLKSKEELRQLRITYYDNKFNL